MKYFIYLIIAVVTASVIAGFFVVGSPQDQRLRSFDERRVQNLQYLQSEIIYYWQGKDRLPARLLDLRDDIRGTVVPLDPQTGAEYGYEVRGPLTFALCATFLRSSPSASGREPEAFIPAKGPRPVAPYSGVEAWDHAVGYICFERTIDKDFYPPLQKTD